MNKSVTDAPGRFSRTIPWSELPESVRRARRVMSPMEATGHDGMFIGAVAALHNTLDHATARRGDDGMKSILRVGGLDDETAGHLLGGLLAGEIVVRADDGQLGQGPQFSDIWTALEICCLSGGSQSAGETGHIGGFGSTD